MAHTIMKYSYLIALTFTNTFNFNFEIYFCEKSSNPTPFYNNWVFFPPEYLDLTVQFRN